MTRTTLTSLIVMTGLFVLVVAGALVVLLDQRGALSAFARSLLAGRDVISTSDLTRGEELLLSDQLVQLRTEIRTRKDELATLQTGLESMREEISGTGATFEDLQWRIADLTAERDRLRPLEPEVRQLRLRNAELERRLAELFGNNPLELYLRGATASRMTLLTRLQSEISSEFPQLGIEINARGDGLQFRGEGLFASGAEDLTAEKRAIVERIAERIDAALVCYSLGPRANPGAGCNPGFAIIDELRVEGHTDDVGSNVLNTGLSARRAVATYAAMLEHVPALTQFENLNGEPIAMVASFGEARPIASNLTAAGRATNRRIELRFALYIPGSLEEIETARQRVVAARN